MTGSSKYAPVLSLSMNPGILPWVLLPLACLVGGLTGHMAAGADTQGIAGLLGEEETLLLLSDTQSDPVGLLLWMGRYLIIALVLGCSTIGIAALPLLLGIHGFSAGYAISAFYRTWGYEGLRMAAIQIAVVYGIMLAALLAVSIPGWTRSLALCTGKKPEAGRGDHRLLDQISFCLIAAAAALIYEHFLCYFAPLIP